MFWLWSLCTLSSCDVRSSVYILVFFFFFVKLLTRLVCAFNEGRTKYNTVQEVEEINQKSFQLNL